MDKFKCYLMPHPPIIIPEVGNGREKDATDTINSMKEIANQIGSIKPDTVILISPHAPMFSDFVFMYDSKILQGDFIQFGSNLTLSFSQDNELSDEIEQLMSLNNIPGGRLEEELMSHYNLENTLDHGALVPLYYLGQKYDQFKVVVMSPSFLDIQMLYKTGQLINQAAINLGRNVVLVASGDMSHKVNSESPYGAIPEGKTFDQSVVDNLKSKDLAGILSIEYDLREKAGECGYNSLIILCGYLDKKTADIKVMSYEAPFGIGYCVAEFNADDSNNAPSVIEQMSKKEKTESIYVKIARETLSDYILNGETKSVEDYKQINNEELFKNQAGVFVSIKKFGSLRGCIGTTAPTTDSIAEEIIQNAISAGTHDPRFNPISQDELEFLDISVDVLSKAVPIKSRDELDPKKYGVIVSKGNRRGLLLPDLAGVDSTQDQLEIACNKGGIDPKEQYDIFKFTVTRYH